jgi:hypothetical protein
MPIFEIGLSKVGPVKRAAFCADSESGCVTGSATVPDVADDSFLEACAANSGDAEEECCFERVADLLFILPSIPECVRLGFEMASPLRPEAGDGLDGLDSWSASILLTDASEESLS